MTIQITIIGLGQIGTSIGLALADKKDLLTRVGHDREPRVAKQAEKLGAFDKVLGNIYNSVKDADIVILALPVDQIQEMLEFIGQDLKENAVVMDTAPVKEVVAKWAKDALPENRHYVGLTPVLNPAYLHEHETGVEAAHPDLFKGGMMVIVAPSRTASEAIKLASDLSRLLGATPLFADPVEVDSLMAATHILPQLMAAALLNVTVDQPGWREGRKLAGRAFTEVTGPIVQTGEPDALCSSALLAQENVVRVIDSLIAALQGMKNDIKNQEEKSLIDRLERARNGRESWWSQRQAANWTGEELSAGDMPKSSDVFSRLMGLGRRPRPPKQDQK
jgi:prephenate dehydrogenase